MNQLIIENGFVCDGSGKEPELKDLLITDDRITSVSPPGTFKASEAPRVDAGRKIVAPGFIDAHSHRERMLLKYPDNRSQLLQGVTTEVCGNCGFSAACVPGENWADLAGFLAYLKEHPVSTNTVILCGHNDIRRTVMKESCRPAEKEEIRAMARIMEEAFALGAAGWSSGLTYFPGKFASTEELKTLNELTKNTRKVYASHIRSEGDELLEAVREAAEIARAGSGRLQISHLKTIFPRNYHKIDQLLALLEELRASGLTLTADRYPYIYSSTRIGQTLPEPYSKMADITSRLQGSAAFQEEVTVALKQSPRDLPTTLLTRAGKTLGELACERQCSVEKVCMEALREDAAQNAAYLCMSAENLERILALPFVAPGSDGLNSPLDDPSDTGHPRAAGTFPLFFRMTAALTSVGEAVRKMTSLPAGIFRIPDRGLLREGYMADIVIFDPGKFDSKADFSGNDPFPEGVDSVFVAGRKAWSSTDPGAAGRFGKFLPVD